MADISPFLSSPQKLVEELAQLNVEIGKLEDVKERKRKKLLEIMKSEGLETLTADKYIAVISKRKSADFSQKALEAEFGALWLAAAKERLPVKEVESLSVREIKDEKADIGDKLMDHFGGGK